MCSKSQVFLSLCKKLYYKRIIDKSQDFPWVMSPCHTFVMFEKLTNEKEVFPNVNGHFTHWLLDISLWENPIVSEWEILAFWSFLVLKWLDFYKDLTVKCQGVLFSLHDPKQPHVMQKLNTCSCLCQQTFYRNELPKKYCSSHLW